jgi:hypothetical protein
VKKIPCVFKRDFSNPKAPKILDEITPGCEWVLAGEGVATVKHDGSACLVRDGQLFRRYDAKRGKEPPKGFEPAQEPDPVTGHWPGWVPVDVRNPDPADVWHALAWHITFGDSSRIGDDTFELCGPRINGGHDGVSTYMLIRHGCAEVKPSALGDRSFESLRSFLENFPREGVVFWRERGNINGDLAKLTRENFGFPWPLKKDK